jgi:hypothetical protein
VPAAPCCMREQTGLAAGMLFTCGCMDRRMDARTDDKKAVKSGVRSQLQWIPPGARYQITACARKMLHHPRPPHKNSAYWQSETLAVEKLSMEAPGPADETKCRSLQMPPLPWPFTSSVTVLALKSQPDSANVVTPLA